MVSVGKQLGARVFVLRKTQVVKGTLGKMESLSRGLKPWLILGRLCRD
jgi:hypothetical protein